MAIFGKKQEEEHHHPHPNAAPPPSPVALAAKAPPPAAAYGINDIMRLLRTLPIDQHAELIVRVIRTTLESVNVHASDLIGDASKQQQRLSDRITSLQTQVQDLTKQIEGHRAEIARLESELAETSSAKERLQAAEQDASAATPTPAPGTLPGVTGHGGMPPIPKLVEMNASGGNKN
jgi:hypothetical protein